MKNQSVFRRCTAIDRVIKNRIVTAVQQVFLSPIMYQLTVLGRVKDLEILEHIFRLYGAIDEIYLK